MNKKITVSVVSLVSVLFFSVMAFADEATQNNDGRRGPRGGSPVKMMDTDGDGSVSKSEWINFQSKIFSKMDKDGNGSLSEDEFTSGRPGGRRGPGPGR